MFHKQFSFKYLLNVHAIYGNNLSSDISVEKMFFI